LGYKVFISTTDTYKVFVDTNVGMTQSIAFIRCDSQTQAEKYSIILQHRLFIFLNNICRWGNFNNVRILQKFPIPIQHDVYRSFHLSPEEIEHIENNL
jgi:hypothetical protein